MYNVKNFGVVGDNQTLNSNAIQKAIDTTSKNGGGRVYFPPGDYLTGTIRIKSNVTLYLEAGATIWGSKNSEDYYPYGFSYLGNGSLICAKDADNIAIQGRGTINGNGTSFYKKAKSRWVVRGWRPDCALRFVNCKNLLLEDITVRNTPFWAVHPIDCEGVTIRGISIFNGIYAQDGVNTDGINPDGCSNVRISDCYIESGDDSICLKCSNPNGRHICKDISITNCILASMEGAFRIGPETEGGGEYRNIAFSNCVIRDAGCGIGFMLYENGIIDGVLINNVAMTLTDGGQPIYMWLRRRSRGDWGTVKNITVSSVNAVADGCIFISGAPEKHLKGLTFENIKLFMRGGRDKPYHKNPPYPFLPWQHRHSPYDIACRWVDDLKLRNIELIWNTPEKLEWGSAIRCWDVNNLEIDRFSGRQSLGSDEPAIWLRRVNGALIHNCKAPEGTSTFLMTDKGTKDVSLMNNDLSHAGKIFDLPTEVKRRELLLSGNRPTSLRRLKRPEQIHFTEEDAKAQIESLRKITGATEDVFSVAFSPDGKILAGGGADYTVKLWNVKTGKMKRTFWGHTEEVFSVCFSPDGKILASGSNDCLIRLWDVTTGKKRHVLAGHEYYVWSVVFSPDGRRLATSNYDSKIIIWDTESGREVNRLSLDTNWAFSLAFSPDGRILASGYWDRKKTTKSKDEVTHIILWDTKRWKKIRTFAGNPEWIWSIAFSPDGNVLASAGEDKIIRMWDVVRGREIKIIRGHSDEVTSIAFSPDGKTLASGSKDKTVRLWNLKTGKEMYSISGHTDIVWSVAFSPDGKTLASGSADRKIKLWDVKTREEISTLHRVSQNSL